MKRIVNQTVIVLSTLSVFFSMNLQARAVDAETIQYINAQSIPEDKEDESEILDYDILEVDEINERPLVSNVDNGDDEEEIVINNYGLDMEIAYSTTHRAAHHHVLDILNDCVELEDHSIWKVRDKNKVGRWLPSHTIAIAVNTNIFTRWFYPYKFVNLDTKEIVKSKLKLPGILNDPNIDIHIHWIKNIDYVYGYVRLEDGSLWKISSNDSDTLNSFSTHQIVIVGTNDGWFRSSYPNILISVKNGKNVRGIVVN